jgi:hypothetical protein
VIRIACGIPIGKTSSKPLLLGKKMEAKYVLQKVRKPGVTSFPLAHVSGDGYGFLS